MTSKIDKEKIPSPSLQFSTEALQQLQLIAENDFTLAGKYFRLLISGKGCDGFTYSTGFTDLKDDDFIIPISNYPEFEVVMDPFTAFYLQNATVDYHQDFANNCEGFVVNNHNQEVFAGKFWKQNPDKVPSLAQAEALS